MVTYKGNTINVASDNCIEFNNKPVRVIGNKEYTYKFNKASISAQGGAKGLTEFMSQCIEDNFGLVWVEAIVEHLAEITKED